jgi:hypothetical protein
MATSNPEDVRQLDRSRRRDARLTSHGEVDMLNNLWWQWVRVVELVANGSRSRLPLAPQQYRLLHADLLRALNAQANDATESHQTFLLELASWVKPWLTQEALLRTDQEILLDLLQRCEQAGEKIGPRPPRPLPWKWFVVLVLIVVAVSMGVFSDLGGDFALSAARQTFTTLRRLAMSPYWVGGAVLLVAFVYAFWPNRRP